MDSDSNSEPDVTKGIEFCVLQPTGSTQVIGHKQAFWTGSDGMMGAAKREFSCLLAVWSSR